MTTDLRAAQLAARLQRIPTSRASWMLVILAAGALVIEALDIGSLSIILPGVKVMWQLTPAQVGMLAAASALGIAIGMVPAGRLADRFGRKRLLVGGVIWFCTGTMLSAASPNYPTLMLLRGVSGLGMAPAFIMPYRSFPSSCRRRRARPSPDCWRPRWASATCCRRCWAFW